jgi:hypothetical protein
MSIVPFSCSILLWPPSKINKDCAKDEGQDNRRKSSENGGKEVQQDVKNKQTPHTGRDEITSKEEQK